MPMAVQTGGGEGNVPAATGTDVVLSGKYAEAYYQVTVPATMSPGDSGQVKVVGAWKPSQTLKVTCPNKVTLAYGEQTLDVGITFEGIEQAGSLLDEFSITKDISVENKAVMFGTWTGHLTYTVEMVTESNIITFTIGGTEYQADKGMTWSEWFASDYNTTGKTEETVHTITDSEGISVELSAVIVDGTAYEVVFIPVITLDINEFAVLVNVEYAKCIINGISYNLDSTDTQLQLPVGTTIECYATGGGMSFSVQSPEATITVNGQVILSTSEDNAETETLSLTYTVTGDATIHLTGGSAAGHITITEK